jgi:hypothetical protein
MVTTSYKWQPGATFLTQTNDGLTQGNQDQSVAASNVAGTAFLAAWHDPNAGNSIQGRLMHADGTPFGSQFKVNTTSGGGGAFDPSVTGLADGRYVVVFDDYSGADGDIRARIINADGTPSGDDFLIMGGPIADSEPHVAALTDGGFAVTWTRDLGGNNDNIGAVVMNADGSIRVPAFPIATTPVLAEHHSSIAGLANGTFVTAWSQEPVAGGSSTVYFARYAANGTKLGASTLIDAIGSLNDDIHIAGLPDGGFVVTYTDNGWGLSGSEITARVYNADGSARSSYLLVNDSAVGGKTTGVQSDPSLAVLPNGDFAVGWHDVTTNLEYLRAFDAQGHSLGTNQVVLGNAADAQIAGLGGGQVGMVSDSLIPDGSGTSIRSKIYELVRTIDGDASNETINASEDGLKETINGAGGDDTVVFSHKFNDYTVGYFGQKLTVIGPNGTVTLSGVEHLTFLDDTFTATALVSPPSVHWSASTDIGSHPAGWRPSFTGDFNGDGTSDALWFNPANNNIDIWSIQNGHWAGSSDVGTHPAGWQPAAVGDYNGDGTDDVLWLNPANNHVDIWKMSNGHWAGSSDVGTHPAGYTVAGAGDFNHDGTSDVLWYNAATGDTEVWMLSGGHWSASVDIGPHPAGWQPAGVGDFNRDGTSDVLWHNPMTNEAEIWMIQNGHWASSVNLGSHPPGYEVAAVGDFAHDGTSDVLWYNPTNGDVDLWKIADGHWAGSEDLGTHPAGWAPAGAGDFNHDGITDVLWGNAAANHLEAWLLGNA